MLEIQNGVLAGYYFGYSQTGEPEWRLFSGKLKASGRGAANWEMTADLQRFEGGSCITCPYVAPEEPTTNQTIKLEFLNRTQARFQVDGGSFSAVSAFTYGVAGRDIFPGTMALVPDITGMWTLVTHDREIELQAGRQYAVESREVYISEPLLEPGRLSTLMFEFFAASTEALAVASIDCETQSNGKGGVCRIELFQSAPQDPKTYFMPIGNLSDAYFYAKAPDGDTLEGIRISYD